MSEGAPEPAASPPSLALARRIAAALVAERLLRPSDADRLATKLADGTMTAEAWRTAIRRGVPAEAREPREGGAAP
jgi:hypothetical protein